MINSRLYYTLLSIVLLAAIILPRLPYQDRFVTADEPRWQANVAGFTTKLATGRIGELLQQPHPGITTQWFAAPGIWQQSWAGKKLPLIIAQCVLLLFTGYLMRLLWGKPAGYIGTLFLALNPFLIAHTRIYAMDALLAIFLLISILALLVWNKNKETRYLVYAGTAGALAFLSKLSGIIIVPYALIAIYFFLRTSSPKIIARACGVWLAAFIISSIIVLPSFIVRPLGVLGDMGSFFGSGDYTVLHQYGNLYYLQTLLFLTAPIPLATLICVILGLDPGIHKNKQKKELLLILLFAALFIIMMTIGAKKGDRYILPAFVLFDVCAAYVASRVVQKKKVAFASVLVAAAVALQVATIIRIHPYELAYVNPLTKHWIGNRQLGWGEGLDIALEYLKAKPNPENLKVAMYYSSQFESKFPGEVVPLHQWDSGSNNYAVLYRAMYGRGEDAWETDVLNHFKSKTPEKIIELNGIPYIWIYRLR
ncbi:MAG: hypothetical protein A3D99_00025 [Candidatus Andersenbacteria bacterium RIFCSPHIGHO2_12_FULL_45_11]|uniref:Glycosyltransferase RgtA/B/C/D-like domain-containing protein n=1 Tax=Candidatus Andersenbacteria bacterium RIFCSPHIGHO2_12_FULL_45_11 TaxID=1797281 RepID=A0A1G1X200_9BACT|nr:MAG: hypothetical protein A3D99_00025 [Candidatus Andersenbacteria bacterium RIFCSPHIGHO2_12_FULL_45_11]